MGCKGDSPIDEPDQALSDQGTLDAEQGDAEVDPNIILEVGFGDPEHFMLAPGSGTTMAVFGIQGGYHMDMGFRVRGLSAADFNSGDWIISYEFRSSTGVPLSEPIARVLSLEGIAFDGTGQVRTGDRVFFTSSDPSAHDQTTITLEVRLTNGTRFAVSTEEVTLVVP